MGGVEAVSRGPAVESIADVRRNAFFAGETDRITNQALLDRVMDLGKSDGGHADASSRDRGACLLRGSTRNHVRADRRIVFSGREAGTERDIPIPVPEVTIRSLSEPASAPPRASMALLSISQFCWNREKSWIKAV
jgi:hypothetical protein